MIVEMVTDNDTFKKCRKFYNIDITSVITAVRGENK